MKKIILLLVLSILFVHYSCENDFDDIIEESENHSHSKNPIKKKEIISYKTFLEINKETKLSKEFDNIFFKKSNNTINIDTTEIVSITTDYQVTYTFKVNEDSLINGFRNIIIQSTPNNNKFFLVEYPPNFNQSTNNEGLQVKVKQISENNINVKHSESLCIAIFECSEGEHTASNQEEWHKCVATKKPAYALVPCGGVSTGGPSGEDPRGGMNEGIPTDPLDGQGNNSNYSSANVLAQYINLSTIEINWLIENPNISNKFLQLLSANDYSNQSKDFIKWAIDYLNVNYQAKNYFNQNPQDLEIIFNTNFENTTDSNLFYSASANVVVDILINNKNGTLNNLNLNWPNLDNLKQKIRDAISRGVYTTAKYTRDYIYIPMSKMANKYPSTVTWSNKAIDKIRIDAVTPLVNFNPNTMGWGDLFNIWLFELTPGNFSNNTINFTNSSNVITGNNIYNPTTNAVKNFPKGNNTPGGTLLNIQSKLANGLGIRQTTSGYFKYDVNAFYSTLSNVNLGIQMLGSYPITATVITKSSNTAVVQFHITNDLGWESGTRFIKGTNGGGNQGVIPNKPIGSGLHLGGTITNTFVWTETVNF